MKSFLVIGIGRFGFNLAKTLYELGHEVLAIDEDEERIEEIAEYVTHAVAGDATDETVLKSLGARNFDVAVVALGESMEASILITVLLKEMGVKYIVGKAQSELHAKILTKVGIDRAILPERDMGVRVAHNLAQSNILDYIELSPEHSILEMSVPKKWIGKTLRELDVRARYGVSIMAVKNGVDINISPDPESILSDEDVLVIIGDNDDLNKIKM